MINPVSVQRAARELYERHGRLALDIARERAKGLDGNHDMPTLDAALMVLTEVERLVGTPAPQVMMAPTRRPSAAR